MDEPPSHKGDDAISEVAKRTFLTFNTIRKPMVGPLPVDCDAGVQPENYSVEGFLSNEPTFS